MAIASSKKGFGKPKPIKTTNNAWKAVPWAKVQRKVFKLQKSIFQAAKSGQDAKVRRLQRLLVKSYYARLLAVRRVTQDNQGKKTAGVDGVRAISPRQRFELVENIKGNLKAKPLRRVWIPKPGRDEKRPLGIPTIQDRARQALVKSALEPEWESRFEGTSYGFRPGRSAQDAIGRIYSAIKQEQYFVLDADIAKCFDRINHDYLLSKIHCPSSLKRDLKQWLKAGVLDNGVYEDTETGTPQGGVISPLLANIALLGMERLVKEMYPNKGTTTQVNLIRYADDFVVISRDLGIIEQCKTAISEWLKPVGLEIKPEKTRIGHTLKPIEYNGKIEEPGFDFLGFNIRQYPVGKYKSGKTGGVASRLIGHKTHIKPSNKAVKAHTEVIKGAIKQLKTAPQSALISKLNPIIRGWSNYYSGVVSMETFNKLDDVIWQMLRAWTVSRCGKASYKKLSNYFRPGKVKLSNGRERQEAWMFQTKDGIHLYKHKWTPIVRHTLVRPDATPYDGNWTYWATRKGQAIDTPKRVAKLLKKQKGRCAWCGQYFTPSDLLEVDHIVPRSQGGKNEHKNLQLLHRHCHDDKTALDEERLLYS
ncbi:group II intron reverse transcriptase/maturase [Arthrospira platensis]|jgi:RNA-directed DNA polymerase|uniref:Reverse transcriptase homolog n=1 Tax=Limnospira platensis NIES-46 TaxID=1236695 RepID=A0A5M3T7U4_LIMPL|nr:group II intron reverse transcriptase/maturase [Arthrospira platensis]AMW29721.1 group II intron reverse transcriptase/maturase [Arthrospira platensis YZ]KDR55818.1 DNA polymerase [Arthrospira platensis str. Paraca]MBD2668230.1 group II intron reverse transcriptase/maturase [Arthrospira platensis FACHB-439]MBD2709917.1 group II intron reverse transcriptase/maturase [Arthrospira platensis FACHB-835]MDF2212299.1 group II intron reverse transcriptase/maturase [Arthrospira platensis NCB002]QQW